MQAKYPFQHQTSATGTEIKQRTIRIIIVWVQLLKIDYDAREGQANSSTRVEIWCKHVRFNKLADTSRKLRQRICFLCNYDDRNETVVIMPKRSVIAAVNNSNRSLISRVDVKVSFWNPSIIVSSTSAMLLHLCAVRQ